MKKMIIILVVLAVVVTTAAFACNGGKGISKNNEGLADMPTNITLEGLVKKERM